MVRPAISTPHPLPRQRDKGANDKSPQTNPISSLDADAPTSGESIQKDDALLSQREFQIDEGRALTRPTAPETVAMQKQPLTSFQRVLDELDAIGADTRPDLAQLTKAIRAFGNAQYDPLWMGMDVAQEPAKTVEAIGSGGAYQLGDESGNRRGLPINCTEATPPQTADEHCAKAREHLAAAHTLAKAMYPAGARALVYLRDGQQRPTPATVTGTSVETYWSSNVDITVRVRIDTAKERSRQAYRNISARHVHLIDSAEEAAALAAKQEAGERQ